jgi:hypothetical protein
MPAVTRLFAAVALPIRTNILQQVSEGNGWPKTKKKKRELRLQPQQRFPPRVQPFKPSLRLHDLNRTANERIQRIT